MGICVPLGILGPENVQVQVAVFFLHFLFEGGRGFSKGFFKALAKILGIFVAYDVGRFGNTVPPFDDELRRTLQFQGPLKVFVKVLLGSF